MSLTQIPLPADADLTTRPLPAGVERLVCEAERRIALFFDRERDTPIPAFVPSDFRAIWRALAYIRERRLAPGRSVCEWGSGFGVVAILASSLGYYAAGIEVEPRLVAEAVSLAADFDLDVEFARGSFVPAGGPDPIVEHEDMAWLDTSSAPAYEALDADPDDFDLVFAYPWPGEQQVVHDLFDAHAATGALLLTYLGTEGLRLHRRDRPAARRRPARR